MNNVPVVTKLLKVQIKPTVTNYNKKMPPTVETSITPQKVAAPVMVDSNSFSKADNAAESTNNKTPKVVKNNPSNVMDISFRAENLQQLTTNALPPFIPAAPPRFIKLKNRRRIETHCCCDCGDTFNIKSNLTFHLERRSVLIRFPCEACKSVRIFYNRCTLLSHIRSHTDKHETSDIRKAVVNPLPRVLMDGLQAESSNTLGEELNSIDDVYEIPPAELLEFSLQESEEDNISLNNDTVVPSNVQVKCLDCNEIFDSAEARKEHLTNGERIPVLVSQCNKCGMVCPSKCSLKAHQRIHLQVSPYVCPECGDSPDYYWSNFQHHVKYKCFHNTRSIGYKCPVCKRVSPSTESLLKHMELHTEKYLKCDLCPRAYTTLKSFEAHVKEHHPGLSLTPSPIFKCSLCDIVFLNNEQVLGHRASHLKEQTCEYVFNCMQCGKPLENKMLLLEHIQTCHPKIYKHIVQDDKPEVKPQPTANTYRGKVECLICHCSFHSYQGYSVHLSRAHINVNQPCSYCFMIIGNRREMVNHGKKHLNKGNIVCLLCNNKKCQDEKNLDLHLAWHVDKLQYCTSCPICNDILPSSHQALSHLRKEHFMSEAATPMVIDRLSKKIENTSCHFCRVSFENDSQLQEHLKTKHILDNQQQKRNAPAAGRSDEIPSKKQCIEGKECAKCGFQSTERSAFKEHLLTHKTKKSSVQCQECGLCFVVEPSLIKHLMIVHKISDAKKYIEEEGTNFMPDFQTTADVPSCDSLICSVCFTTFPTETALKSHMRSHGMAFIQANKSNSTV